MFIKGEFRGYETKNAKVKDKETGQLVDREYSTIYVEEINGHPIRISVTENKLKYQDMKIGTQIEVKVGVSAYAYGDKKAYVRFWESK